MSFIKIDIANFDKRAESLVNLIELKLTEPHGEFHVKRHEDGTGSITVYNASIACISKVINWVKRTKVEVLDTTDVFQVKPMVRFKPNTLTFRIATFDNNGDHSAIQVFEGFPGCSVSKDVDKIAGQTVHTIKIDYPVLGNRADSMVTSLIRLSNLCREGEEFISLTPFEYFTAGIYSYAQRCYFNEVDFGIYRINSAIPEEYRETILLHQPDFVKGDTIRVIAGQNYRISDLVAKGYLTPKKVYKRVVRKGEA